MADSIQLDIDIGTIIEQYKNSIKQHDTKKKT